MAINSKITQRKYHSRKSAFLLEKLIEYEKPKEKPTKDQGEGEGEGQQDGGASVKDEFAQGLESVTGEKSEASKETSKIITALKCLVSQLSYSLKQRQIFLPSYENTNLGEDIKTIIREAIMNDDNFKVYYPKLPVFNGSRRQLYDLGYKKVLFPNKKNVYTQKFLFVY